MRGNVTFQLAIGNLEIGSDYVDKVLEADAILVFLEVIPQFRGHGVEAVAHPFFNVEKHPAVLRISGAHRSRGVPNRVRMSFHGVPRGLCIFEMKLLLCLWAQREQLTVRSEISARSGRRP